MRPQVWRRCPGIWAAQETDVWFKCFQTHAEAIAYADKVSRTITVTLPPYQPWVATGDLELFFGGGHTAINSRTDPEKGIWVKPDEATPVALALLATAHYRERNQQ